MGLNIELRDLIRQIVKDEFEEIYGVACKVSNVREDPVLGHVCDCTPLKENPKIIAVRLQAESADGVLVIPSDNSVVFATMEDETHAFISMYGAIDSIKFFSGSNGGLVKVSELVDKLNVLEDRMISHQHISAPPSSPTGLDPATNPPITDTVVEDLENPLILH